MARNDQDIIKKILIIVIFLALFIVAFLVVYPFLAAILTASILAYVLRPVYKKINSKLNKPNLTAFLICFVVLIITSVGVFFALKITINEIVTFYSYIQTQDILAPIKILFGKANFPAQVSVLFDQAIGKGIESIMNYFATSIASLPFLLLQFFILFFVLFYFLREAPFLADYFKNIIPFKEKVRKQFFSRFQNITKGVIYGTVLAGVIDGFLVGAGLYIFNVPNAFILTAIAVFLGILPIVGPGMVWIPVVAFMLINGDYINAIGLSLFCVVVANGISRIFMVNLIGRKGGMSNAIALVGMLGGLKLIGLIGLIIGPLVLDYFLLFIEFYKKGQIKRLI